MPRLRLESALDGVDLNEVTETGYGMEALSGVSGLGLPPMVLRFLEGAGDGASYQGRRVASRSVDIPLYLHARHRDDLIALESRMASLLTQPMTLRFIEDDGSDWSLPMYLAGGGDWVYGVDTDGVRELRTVVTLRSSTPYWTYSDETARTFGTENPGRGLIKDTTAGNTGADSFIRLRFSGVQPQGPVVLENKGNVEAFPKWVLRGPLSYFSATSQAGEVFSWSGTLTDTDTLTIDAGNASVRDQTGANRYAELGTAPKLWRVQPGLTVAQLVATSIGAPLVTVSWRARRWSVI